MNDRYTPTFNIHEAVRKTLPYMMEMREYFHAHPELSEKEFDTCKTIFQELSLMGIEDVKIIAGTGVTGLIRRPARSGHPLAGRYRRPAADGKIRLPLFVPRRRRHARLRP